MAPLGSHHRGVARHGHRTDARRARVSDGSRVLDVAAGAGGQTLAAARRVGPSGHVLATDISPTILEYAAKTATDAGLTNVATRELDGERLTVAAGAFDAVISRVGLIYFPDQQAALAGMRTALRPGGRISAVVYSTADRNGFFSIPIGIIRRRAQLPPPQPGQPGPFSLGAPGVAERVLTEAGFRDVDVEVVSSPVRMASRRGMRPVRAGVLRRAAADAGRPGPGRAGGGLGRDRGRAAAVRGPGRVHRTVRDAGGLGHPLSHPYLTPGTARPVAGVSRLAAHRAVHVEGLRLGARPRPPP